MKNDSYEALQETLKYALREEAMARSKGWGAADDWLEMANKTRLRMVSRHVLKQSLIRAWAVINSEGQVYSLCTDEVQAETICHAQQGMRVEPLYGINHAP